MADPPKIIVVCGPTGVGKTGFAVRLARHLGTEIVGADSMQIYRHMSIGTAKPTPGERAAVTHHLVDVIEPDQPFDAAAYARMADEAIQGLLARGCVPLVVGGTGLYIKALLFGLFQGPSIDPVVRSRLRERMAREGPAAMHRLLAAEDPRAAERIHPNDSFRILRALEVHAATGRPMSELQECHGFGQPRYDSLRLGLSLPREQLYARIDRRVDQMLSEGLEREVRQLLERGYAPELKAMQALGYRHMLDYIAGRWSWDETVRLLKRDHRRYAKRQFTWFNADPQVVWLSPGDAAAAQALIDRFLDPPPGDHP